MISMVFPSCVVVALSLALLIPATVCDYQLEVNLITYNNSARRLADGSCCDLEGGGGVCLAQDTCDVRFTFSIQNFVTGTTFHSQTKVLAPYENTDVIIFPSCGTLMNNERNPLTFIVPTNQWSAEQRLRLSVVIDDVDINFMTGAPTQESILELFPIIEIPRPSAPNATFTNTQTFIGANSLTLIFQYRIICNTSTCGSDCSQTTNCQPFPSCVPITCADSPCLNGGTCSNVTGGGYTCECVSQCQGTNCDVCMNNIMKNTYHRPVTTTWFTKSSNEIGITSISHTVGVATTTTENLILSSRAPEVSPQSDPLQPVTAVEDPGSVLMSCPICDEASAAVVSSIAVAILTSMLFFTVGFLSGYFTLKCQYKHTSSTIAATFEQPDGQLDQGQTQDQPLYEAIPGVENQNIELEENAAYSATSAVHSNDQQELEMGENIAYISVQQGVDED